MISTAKALYEFFSGFGIPAYPENTVPDDAVLPYLSYSLAEPEWDQVQSFYVKVYYRNRSSYLESLTKADEIVREIGTGIVLPCEPHGYIAIHPQTPLIQQLPPEEEVRGAYINLSIHAYHMPGY